MIIETDVVYDPNADYSEVTAVLGSLNCRGADTTAAFPALTSIGGWLYCSGSDTTAAFPALTSIGGGLDCSGADTTAAFPVLTSIGSSLYCGGADTTAAFPVLTSIGGGLDCRGADTTAAFPVLTSIGGGLYCRGADTTAAFPVLTSIGGWLDCSEADTTAAFSPDLIVNDTTASSKCKNYLKNSFMSNGMLFADQILAKIVRVKKSHKTTVYTVIIVGKIKKSYVVEVEGVFSHGDTVKEAKDSLIYKLSDRDTSKYKNYNKNTVLSFAEAVQAYRAITGACESGTKHFCDGIKLKKKYAISEIIELTKHSYGGKVFADFFVNNC